MALFLLFHFSPGSVFIFCPVLICDNVMIYASPQVQYQRLSWEKSAARYILCCREQGFGRTTLSINVWVVFLQMTKLFIKVDQTQSAVVILSYKHAPVTTANIQPYKLKQDSSMSVDHRVFVIHELLKQKTVLVDRKRNHSTSTMLKLRICFKRCKNIGDLLVYQIFCQVVADVGKSTMGGCLYCTNEWAGVCHLRSHSWRWWGARD